MTEVCKSYEQLLKEGNDPSAVTYLELLMTKEWKNLRHQLLTRDDYYCKKCGSQETIKQWDNAKKEFCHFQVHIPIRCRKNLNWFNCNGQPEFFYIFDERDFVITEVAQPVSLHIHHRYYRQGCLPWEYETECFESLCVYCHYALHQNVHVPMYIQLNGKWVEWKDIIPCLRCRGAGILPQFDHVEGGICFRCWGTRYEELITSDFKEKSKSLYNNFLKEKKYHEHY